MRSPILAPDVRDRFDYDQQVAIEVCVWGMPERLRRYAGGA